MEYIPLPMKTNKEKFIDVCIEALDTDPSTPDTVKDEVGCADTVSFLIRKVFPDFKILVSTKDLDAKLLLDKRFERVLEPQKGDIIISPRTNTTFGHTGVFITSERIASNNSFGAKKGIFNGNYTWDEWVKEFKNKRGLRVYLYRIKN